MINSNGRSPAGWDQNATLSINGTSYSPGDHPSARIYWVTNVRGDCNDDDAFDNSDIDPFVLLLTTPAEWEATYPWARDAELFMADVGGGPSECQGDCHVDNGDIDCFVGMLTGGPTATLCAGAP